MTDRPVSELVCAGCGAAPPAIDRHPYPFRCLRADSDDDIDHVMTRTLDLARVRIDAGADLNPFVRYRDFLHSYHIARSHGLSDGDYRDLVERLCREVAVVDGRAFVRTPVTRGEGLEDRLGMAPHGALWIKDETHNVAGSHKARHLLGVMLYLQVIERLGLTGPPLPDLAIASCGNAALAAAVVARAAGRALRVFVPPTANPHVLAQLEGLGAAIEICERHGAGGGDPAVLHFRDAADEGALPFCCQGSENGLTIEGGETLVLELLESLPQARIDRLFVQVGGGALASACIQGLREAQRLGLIERLPRVHAVQTVGAFPLKRAYDHVAARLADHAPGADWADTVRTHMRYARAHRSEFMWPWEEEPRSIAHGILDDETYDWAVVVEGMLETGGYPIVVAENELEVANALARESTEIDVDHTGSAGLAGLIHALASEPSLAQETVAVIFTGKRR